MNISDVNYENLQVVINKYFRVNQVVFGSQNKPFIMQFQGEFLDQDTEKIFMQLEKELKEYGVIPLFRKEDTSNLIFLVKKPEKPQPLKPSINLILFFFTLISVLLTGGLYGFTGELSADAGQMFTELIKSGWPFAIALLSILAAHEFGHYFAGKRHGVQVTLPYFIPFPFSIFGTMGAFINMRSLPRNKRELFDLAITGPLSGLIVSIIVLFIGLSLSTLGSLPSAPASEISIQMEGNSLIYLLIKYLTFGKLLPSPTNLEGSSLIIFWLQYFFTGKPFPWGALDVLLHPVAWAGWAGIFVTGLNLIPTGQLDGGHIFYALFGKKTSQFLFPIIISALILMGFFWNTWWIWAALLFILGRRYAEPLDQITELDTKRKWLGFLGLITFIVTFIPVPIAIY